ncbi:hypothetical protein K461DRAFT_321986 [Myriangium duriaei CBS 260.36]|uniref:Maintenance of telomere capping protein 1 n=1 Tax=Myriangium duriaei CBS 260.36 TaxID=1168546 RepID=A0A9P4MJ84_9PEZI|nr:hypothetical protein K461DRAFT_321986 [Myriangium duriaei CBS 260.36]
MAAKKALTDEELFAQFEDIPSSTPDAAAPKSTPASKPPKLAAAPPPTEDDDPLAELTALASAKPPVSRPHTPHLASSTTSGTTGPKVATPSSSGPPSGRNSEDRRSADTPRDSHAAVSISQSMQSSAETVKPVQAQEKASSGGGWWGSVFTAASAAVKQAEAAAKQIRSNEEAMKWAEQMRGNVETLKAYGGNVRSLAMPTFTNLLETIAPPISAHERLQIHTTHDILGYPSLDPIVYSVFARVMSQVEGGDLLVIQRGTESRARDRSVSDLGYRGGMLGANSRGWSDGPWWRDTERKRDLGAVQGLVEGTKLARANAEAYANEFFSTRGGLEEAAKHATEVLSESNPVRSSDIFLAIQAISQIDKAELFAESQKPKDDQGGVLEPEPKDQTINSFAIYLYDPVHSITFSTISQSFPAQWSEWMDSSADSPDGLPESIKEMIESGGVDAREWVSEWLEETLSLAIGVVAQRYVAKRMGVGEGGIGRGKARAMAEEESAGEAARAI